LHESPTRHVALANEVEKAETETYILYGPLESTLLMVSTLGMTKINSIIINNY